MNTDQRTEMNVEMRRLRQVGQPQDAILIQVALNDDVYFLGKSTSPSERLSIPKKSAKVEAWREYAKSVSEIDDEIIDNASRNDVIKMLEANGLVK